MGIKNTLIILAFLCGIIEARPISYSGGSTIMSNSDNMRDTVYYHYSPTYKYSLGLEAVKDDYFNTDYSYLRFTYLIDRKNTNYSQRNLYFQSGLNSKGFNNNFYGIHGDWETRRWFIGFGYKKISHDSIDYEDKFIQFGLAPYLGEYGDFHTWIMMKSKKNSLSENWSTFPVLKFFKGNFLIEFGYNDETEWDSHIMYRL
tara:strand:- start:2582 stop:3184 length:603 start_codon:yes stop_codon:yes gene_type:complete